MDWIYNFTVALYVNSSFFLHVFISVEIEFSTRTQAQKTDFWIESSHHIMKSSCYHKFTTPREPMEPNSNPVANSTLIQWST